MIWDSTDDQIHELVETANLALYADRKLHGHHVSFA